MLYKVGLLSEGNFQQVPFAYEMYTRANRVGWEQSKEFKKAFSQKVTIDFLGVWYVCGGFFLSKAQYILLFFFFWILGKQGYRLLSWFRSQITTSHHI